MSSFLLCSTIGLLLFAPHSALASGAFSSRYVSQDFNYSHQDNIRKIFRNSEQGRRYFASKERAFYEHLTSRLPEITRIFKRARVKRLPLTRYKITLPVIQLPRIKDVARVSRTAYPLNLVVRRQGPHGTKTLEFSFSRPPRPRALSWLISSLLKVLSSGAAASGASASSIQSSYPCLCKFVGTLGLYVGANVKTDLAAKSSLEGTFRAELQRLLSALQRKLADPSSMKELGLNGGLLPVGPVANKRGLPDPCRVFNPHGPLLDSLQPSLVRASYRRGSMLVIAMVASKKGDWGAANPTITRWLGELLASEHHKRVSLEQRYLHVADKSNRRRSAHLSAMAQVRGRRFEKLLSRIILNRDEPASLREAAARILVTFDPPRPYRTLVRLLSSARNLKQTDGALSVAIKALSAYPRKRAVDLLIRIRNDKNAAWNTRNHCNDALSTVAAKLKQGHPLQRKIRALKGL